MLGCIVLGEENAFPVDFVTEKTIGHLKGAIKEQAGLVEPAHKLILWRVNIPENEKHEIYEGIDIEEKFGGEKLNSDLKTIGQVFKEQPLSEHIHIIVELPATTVGNSANKRLCIDNWAEYTTKDGIVDLPPILIEMLNDEQFKPEPRFKFKDQLDNAKCGMKITLPPLGQAPKHYGEGYHGTSFLVTEQMEEIWNELDRDSERNQKSHLE